MAYNRVQIGEHRGKLTIIADSGRRTAADAIIWRARCDCGQECDTLTGDFRKGRQCPTCGRDRSDDGRRKHGDSRRSGIRNSKKRLYSIWIRMRQRCEKESCTQYRWYGAKGVKVCAEWQDYLTFKEWALSHGYTDDLSIDRKDSSGNYEPANCRWLTKSKNSQLARGLSRSAVMWNGVLSFGC